MGELKEEMAEYAEDVDELKEFIRLSAENVDPLRKKSTPFFVRESKGSRRLFRTVNKMIQRLDGTVGKFEGSDVPSGEEEIVSIDDMISSIRRLKTVEDSSKLQQIIEMLVQIDQDRDGVVKVDDIMKVVDLLSEEKFQMTPKQMSEVLNLVNKEEIIEMDEKLEKALNQSKDVAAAAPISPASESSTKMPMERNQDQLIFEKIPIKDVEKTLGLGGAAVPDRVVDIKPLLGKEIKRLITHSNNTQAEIVHNLEKQKKSPKANRTVNDFQVSRQREINCTVLELFPLFI